MKIEMNNGAERSVYVVSLAAMFIVLVTQIGSCGRHTQSQIVKAQTCEQVVALSGEGVTSSDILLCQRKD